MPVRELAPDEEVVPVQKTVRELRPDEEVIGIRDVPPPGSNGRPQLKQGSLNPVEDFGRQANVGIAEGLGGPVDAMTALINSGIKASTAMAAMAGGFSRGFLSDKPEMQLKAPQISDPVLGSQQIRRGFAALGWAPPVGEDDPDSIAGSMGRITGMGASFLLPLGPAAKAGTEVSMGLRAAPTTVRGAIVQDIGTSAVKSPAKFIAGEVAASAGAGVGGFIAREKFPDSQAASFVGEIIGGLTPAGAASGARLAASGAKHIPGAGIIPTVTGIRLARHIARPFTKSGRRIRAERRIEGAARDPESAIANLNADETLPEAKLTPAQKTGDEGLLSLERSVIESSEQLVGKSDDQIAQATKAIRQAVDDFGGHVPIEKTEIALEEARAYVKSLMDTRMRIAALKTDERIAALGPNATREDANLIAREEIVAARQAVNDHVREAWSAVPETVILPTKNSVDKFGEIIAKTPRAQLEDIPDIARRFLDPESNMKFGEMETVKELQGLRSKLLEEARKARADGRSNTARIADELAEAVLADLGAQADNVAGEAGDALRSALDATAYMKQTFDRGTVGRILAVDKRGAAITPESLTLETTVGKGGPRAKVETEAILKAADTPALRGAVEDFILDDFHRRALSGNRLDPQKAKTFLARHKDVLDDFPELRTRIESAIEADSIAGLAAEKAKGLARRLNDPKISRAAVFLKEPIEGAMERVAKSPKPDVTIREIMKQARRDTTGEALDGIKSAFGDLLLSRASTRTITKEGDLLVSGRALKRLLKDGPVSKMFKTLLSAEEQKRMLDIADVAEKVEMAVLAKGRSEGIIADNPSLLFATIARIAGAQIGRKIAVATGGGTVQTPGIMSNLFKKATTGLTQDPARKLLIDAMHDEDLFAALLTKGAKAESPEVRRKLNAWLLSIGAEELEDEK